MQIKGEGNADSDNQEKVVRYDSFGGKRKRNIETSKNTTKLDLQQFLDPDICGVQERNAEKNL